MNDRGLDYSVYHLPVFSPASGSCRCTHLSPVLRPLEMEMVGGSEEQTGVFTSSSSGPKLEAPGQGCGLALGQPLHSHQALPQNTRLYR